MSDCPAAALPAAVDPSTEARAARLAKFKREQQIVDYLNRGVSVPEIAARVGLSEKRMRAVIREIIARRAPAPPEEFLTIQMSRLNEALLVAFSAMTGATNLKAVDRVVRIVRELNRCHGAFAALGLQRPDPERLAAPVEATAAYGAALICQAQFAPGHDEEIEGAPAIAPGREDASPDAVLIQGSSPATSEAPPAASTGDNRPQLPSRAPDFPRPRPEEPARAGVSKSLPRASRGAIQKAWGRRARERPSRRVACGAAPQDEVRGSGLELQSPGKLAARP